MDHHSQYTAYCDLPFLDAFARLKPDGEPGSSEELDLWASVYGFLLRAANVVVRTPPDDLGALLGRHPLLRGLVDPASRPSGTSIRLDDHLFVDVERNEHHFEGRHPWRIYFMDAARSPVDVLTVQTGALFVDAAGVLDAWKRLGIAGFVGIGTRAAEQLSGWSALGGRWAPAHDIVLADRYLFADPNGARDNLIPLLLSLLPEHTTGSLDPTVLLVARDHDAKAFGKDARTVRDFVLDALADAHPSLKIRLTVALLDWRSDRDAGLHDRRLFLRYGFVESGASINSCFKDGLPASTTRLTFSPLVSPSVLTRVVAELAELAGTVRAASVGERGELAVAGPVSHPLFQL